MNTSEKWKQIAGRVRIGVISDTHGRLHPAVERHFAGVDHIIHAGDVGDVAVLESAARRRPSHGRGGQHGRGQAAPGPAEEATGDVQGIRFLVAHIQRALLVKHEDPAREGYDLVVSGHTHRSFADWHTGALYLNPGSASALGPGEQPSIAVVDVDTVGLDPRIIPLD